jgi:hypothetical protein
MGTAVKRFPRQLAERQTSLWHRSTAKYGASDETDKMPPM